MICSYNVQRSDCNSNKEVNFFAEWQVKKGSETDGCVHALISTYVVSNILLHYVYTLKNITILLTLLTSHIIYVFVKALYLVNRACCT